VVSTDASGLDQLRALTTAQILAADPGPPNFGAIIEGRLLLEQISLTFAAGKQAAVPFIAGSTSNEASVFGLMGFDTAVLRDRFGIDLTKVRQVYERGGPLGDAELLRRVQTDFLFTAPSLGMASLASRIAPAWSYHFDYVPPADRSRVPGALHCANMPYIFGTVDEPPMAHRLRRYWTNFIQRGDPNGTGLPVWAGVQQGVIAPLVISDEFRIVPDFAGPQMRLWFDKWRHDSGAANQP
jgi:para-nitrobenzyl esterase